MWQAARILDPAASFDPIQILEDLIVKPRLAGFRAKAKAILPPDTLTLAADFGAVEMSILTAHCCLDHEMQFSNRAVR